MRLRPWELSELEKLIGYRFRKRQLLTRAVTHRSYRFECDTIDSDNQRLEFLGDAVLGLLTADWLFSEFSDENEGFLTSHRSQATSGKALANAAQELGLSKFIKVGRGEEQAGGRSRNSTLADALEAILGAAFVDGGIRAAKKVFSKVFEKRLAALTGDVWAHNPKGKLQEIAQRQWKASPGYRVVRQEGPPHDTLFTVEVELPGELRAQGRARSKQAAEIRAARTMIEHIDSAGEDLCSARIES